MSAEALRHSDALLIAWRLAELEAANIGTSEIEPVHFFLGFLKIVDIDLAPILNQKLSLDDRSIETKAHVQLLDACFKEAAIDTTRTRRTLRRALHPDRRPTGNTPLRRNAEARQAFQWAEVECLRGNPGPVQPLHVLGGLLTLDDIAIIAALEDAGSSPEELAKATRIALEMPLQTGAGSTRNHHPEVQRERVESSTNPDPGTKRRLIVDRLGRDLTALAREGRLMPVIGRRDEMRSIAQIILRSRKNNAILVGDAGVGKTGIIEGLAQRIVAGAVPADLANKRIIEISMAGLVAGANLRGDMEARLERLISEARNNPDIILFIDEIHMLVGAGQGSGGSMDAANILKPALGRGEIRMIGATTTTEYRRFIEPDGALARRFELVEILEPTRVEAVEILQGLRARMQEHHRVVITDEGVQAAVDFSIRYLPDQRLPDKAIDLVDQACSQSRMQSLSGDLRSQFTEGVVVGPRELAAAVAHRCRIPVGDISEDESTRLILMESVLKQRVKGQDAAIGVVSEAIRIARSGLRNQNRPIGTFLFTGPSGTGKTELAKAVAHFLFGDERGLLRFDMSEYMDEHSVSKFIGSPPGFVGYEHGGQLTEKIRTRPFSVVLLDEIEKAHPKIADIFLQVFDTGFLTDSHGRKCDFRESVIIMTSNLGAGAGRPMMGFKSDGGTEASSVALDERSQQALGKHFRPEFLNRITDVVVFRPLNLESINLIVDLFVERLIEKLKEKDITLELHQSARELLIEQGFSADKGAREMERSIERLVVKPLSRLLLAGEVNSGTRVQFGTENHQMSVKLAGAVPAQDALPQE